MVLDANFGKPRALPASEKSAGEPHSCDPATYGVFHIRTQAAGSEVRGVHIRARSLNTAAHKAAGRSQYLVAIHEKRRSPSGALQFRHKAWPIGERNMTRSCGRMTAPATSAATSAGEARPEASGAIWERLGGMLAPLRISPVYGLWCKKNDFGAIFVRYSAGPGQFQTEKE